MDLIAIDHHLKYSNDPMESLLRLQELITLYLSRNSILNFVTKKMF